VTPLTIRPGRLRGPLLGRGLLGGLDVSIRKGKAILLPVGKSDGVLSVFLHTGEGIWDRRESVLGLWGWTAFG